MNWSRRLAERESSCISFSPLGPVLAHPLPPGHTSFLGLLHMQTLDPASGLSSFHTVWLKPVFGYTNYFSEISASSLSSLLTRDLHAWVCRKWGVSLSVNKHQQDDVGEVGDVPAAATAASPFGVLCQRNRYQMTPVSPALQLWHKKAGQGGLLSAEPWTSEDWNGSVESEHYMNPQVLSPC